MAYLDKNKEVRWTLRGNLPHANQDNVYQFITFRLADSLPQEQIRIIEKVRENFLKSHPEPWDNSTKYEFQRQVGPL